MKDEGRRMKDLTPMALFQRAADLKLNPNQSCVLLAMVSLGIKGITATTIAITEELGWERGRTEGHIRSMKWCRDIPLLHVTRRELHLRGKPSDVLELTAHGRNVLHGLMTGKYQRLQNKGGRPKGTTNARPPAAPQAVVRVQPYRRAGV